MKNQKNSVVLINAPIFQTDESPNFGLLSLEAYIKGQGFETKIHNSNANCLNNSRKLFENLMSLTLYNFKQQGIIYNIIIDKFADFIYSDLEKINDLHFRTVVQNTRTFAESEARIIAESKENVIALAVYSSNVIFVCLVSKYIKKNYPEKKIVFGGPLTFFKPNWNLFLHGFADYLVKGEGELGFLELLKLDLDKVSSTELKKVPNLIFKSDKEIMHGPNIQLEDLDSIPKPDYSNFSRKFPLMLSASRGCTFRCSFCFQSIAWRKFRSKKVETMIGEIKEYSKLGFKNFDFSDSLLNWDDEWLESFANALIKENLGITWNGYFRCENLPLERIKLLKKSGLKELTFGVENFDKEALNLFNKKMDADEAQKVLLDCNKEGLDITMNFIYNYPNETIESFNFNLRIFLSLLNNFENKNFEIKFQHFHVYTDTIIFRNPEKFGVEIYPVPFKNDSLDEETNKILESLNLHWKFTNELTYSNEKFNLLKNLQRNIDDLNMRRHDQFEGESKEVAILIKKDSRLFYNKQGFEQLGYPTDGLEDLFI